MSDAGHLAPRISRSNSSDVRAGSAIFDVKKFLINFCGGKKNWKIFFKITDFGRSPILINFLQILPFSGPNFIIF